MVPEFCKKVHKPGFHCIENNCANRGVTYAPNEIAFADENGLVSDLESHIGFGGDMEPENVSQEKINDLKNLWKEICKKKIDEAYEEFMVNSGLKK
ncbi:hypothetical protein HPK19_25115 (plasmid) [Arthrobacter citreus]|nr:hypothetical protein HPK19_25115 [Arthrobacter citreus]